MACRENYATPYRRYRPATQAFPPAYGMRVVAYKALDASSITRRPIKRARTSSGMELLRRKCADVMV